MIKRLLEIIERLPKSRFLHFSASILFSFAALSVLSLISFRTGIIASLVAFPIMEILITLSDMETRRVDIIDFLFGIAGGIFVCLAALTLQIIVQ